MSPYYDQFYHWLRWLNTTVFTHLYILFPDSKLTDKMTTLVHNIIDGYHDLMDNKSGKLMQSIIVLLSYLVKLSLIVN